MSIGKLLYYCRLEEKKSRYKVSKQVGITPHHLKKIEEEIVVPRWTTAEKLLNYYGLKIKIM